MLYETTIIKFPLGELAKVLQGLSPDEQDDKNKDASYILSVLNDRAERLTRFVKEVSINGIKIYNAYHAVFSLADIDSDENGATVWGIDLTVQDVQDDNERIIASFRVKPSEDDVLVMRHTEGCCNALIYIEREGSHE